jgi:pimeloyl-ACP methyl ester carboxylesterase
MKAGFAMRFARSSLVIVTLIVLALLASPGCAKTTRPGPLDRVQPFSDKPRAGNAYLLRGFIGVFSEGVDNLGREIDRSGVRAHVYQDDQWAALARTIAREYQGKRDAEPLVLIGHSYGADDVIRIARELDKANVPVDLLVTLDPVYQSNGAWDALPFLRGVPVKADAHFVGRLDNFDIKKDRRDLLEPGTDHFNIEKKGAVHEEVVGNVLMTCPPRQTWLATRGKLPEPAVAQQRDARLARDTGSPRQPKQLRTSGERAPAAGDAQTAGHRIAN